MRHHTAIFLLSLLLCLAAASDALAQERSELRMQARDLITLAERARSSLLELETALTTMEERIAELEDELDTPPVETDEPTRDAVHDEIAELRARIETLEAERDARGPTLADVQPRAEATREDLLARFSTTPPNTQLLAARLGDPVQPEPPGVSCTLETATAATLVICRTASLAALDRQLHDALHRARQGQSDLERRFSEQDQRLFRERLESCVDAGDALTEDDGINRARACIASRYRTRIAAISPDSVVTPIAAQVFHVTTNANLRAAPDEDSTIVGRRAACAELQVTGRVAGTGDIERWKQVEPAPGEIAYIAAFLVSEQRPAACDRVERETPPAEVPPPDRGAAVAKATEEVSATEEATAMEETTHADPPEDATDADATADETDHRLVAGSVAYIMTPANVRRAVLRTRPSPNSLVVDSRADCAELQVLDQPDSTTPGWLRVATTPEQPAYIASSLVTADRPAACRRAVSGTVSTVVNPGVFVVDGMEVRLWGIDPSLDETSRHGMAEVLSFYGHQVSCTPRAERFVCMTPQSDALPSLDLAIVALYNGGACPQLDLLMTSPVDAAAYRAARRDAERHGVALQCR